MREELEGCFLTRRVPLGLEENLSVEMAVVTAPVQTFVVLRENSRANPPRRILANYFEHVAGLLTLELRYLKQHTLPLKFVHLAYEASRDPRSPAQWAMWEVQMKESQGLYTLARRERLEPALLRQLSEALSLTAPQRRTVP